MTKDVKTLVKNIDILKRLYSRKTPPNFTGGCCIDTTGKPQDPIGWLIQKSGGLKGCKPARFIYLHGPRFVHSCNTFTYFYPQFSGVGIIKSIVNDITTTLDMFQNDDKNGLNQHIYYCLTELEQQIKELE